MLFRSAVTLLALTLATAASAAEYRPSFHPDRLKGPPAGTPNEVMVLGTPHLSGVKGFEPSMAAPLLDRLAAWRPTGIATEDLSGLQCAALRRFPSRYAATVDAYCADPAPAGRAIGMDVPAANAEMDRVLKSWPASPSAAQRRRLAAVFLAAGERYSGLVQWLRLPENERRADDGLNAVFVAELEKLRARRGETTVIAAALAARLGHERLWSVDDHSADTPDADDPKAAEAAIMRAWDNPFVQARTAENAALEAGLPQPDGLLKLYRAYNAPKTQMLAYRSDFGAALVEPSPQGYGRNYVGYWETRNLRMVANIRDVLGMHPGMRMLAIVGASHKGYYEAYLNQMHDVRLVDVMTVLE